MTRDIPRTERELCLQVAINTVCKDRNNQYGEPEDSFALIAGLWGSYLNQLISSVDVAMMMALMKIARVKGSKSGYGTRDCYIDLAGYAACASEIAAKEYYDMVIKDEMEDRKDENA